MTEQEYAKTMAKEAVDALMRIVRNDNAKDADRIAAGKEILARGLGVYKTPEEAAQDIEIVAPDEHDG